MIIILSYLFNIILKNGYEMGDGGEKESQTEKGQQFKNRPQCDQVGDGLSLKFGSIPR